MVGVLATGELQQGNNDEGSGKANPESDEPDIDTTMPGLLRPPVPQR